jgi:hypothetical protein
MCDQNKTHFTWHPPVAAYYRVPGIPFQRGDCVIDVGRWAAHDPARICVRLSVDLRRSVRQQSHPLPDSRTGLPLVRCSL